MLLELTIGLCVTLFAIYFGVIAFTYIKKRYF